MTERELVSFLRAADMGAELDDTLLLTMLLHNAMPGCDSSDIASELITRFGTFANVCNASFNTLANIMGVGTKGACVLKLCKNATFNLLRSNSTDGIRRLYTTDEIVDFMRPYFLNLTNEQVYIAYLNSRYKIIHVAKHGEGDYESVPFDFKRIIKETVQYDANAVVLCHNHKTNAFPSSNDVVITQKLNNLLYQLGIRLVDHVIFCENHYKSLRESGYIKDFQQDDKTSLFPK